MKYSIVRPKQEDFDIIVADEFPEEEPPTEPRPLLTQAWAKSMNHISEVRKRDLSAPLDVCAPSKGRCSGASSSSD